MKTKLKNITSNTGKFVDGNPNNGELGTIVTAEWLNDVQERVQDVFEELRNVLLLGNLQPDGQRQNQVAEAIKAYCNNINLKVQSNTRNFDNYIPNSKKSNAIDSNSADTVATSVAVKTAYDKGVEAKNAADNANNNANGRVSKSGDTMTGQLTINHAASYLRGKNNGVDDWFVGRMRNNDNDVALASYQHSTGIHLKADRVESNKPIYRGTNQVFDEGNLLPVKHINLRATIPGTTIEYQNATPAELPMGSYTGYTTNAQLSGSGSGVFTGWGLVTKIDNTQAFRQTVNFDRLFAQWGSTTNGWGGVYEYFMLRPQLGVSNLNNVTVCGVYSQIADVNAQPNLNYPAQEAGTLLVTPSANGCQQEYTTFFTNKKFVRGMDGDGWLSWKRIDALDSVSHTALRGAVCAFAMGHPPAGWLKCNGAAVSRTAYANLFSIIGTHYGAGDGRSTFNLPDLRGEFIRGIDEGRGADPNRVFGSWQSDEIRSHNHFIQFNGVGAGKIGATEGGIHSGSGKPYFTDHTGGNETRPRNVALLYCIKY